LSTPYPTLLAPILLPHPPSSHPSTLSSFFSHPSTQSKPSGGSQMRMLGIRLQRLPCPGFFRTRMLSMRMPLVRLCLAYMYHSQAHAKHSLTDGTRIRSIRIQLVRICLAYAYVRSKIWTIGTRMLSMHIKYHLYAHT